MKCKQCKSEMKEIDFSEIGEIHSEGKAYECEECGYIELDKNSSAKLRNELKNAKKDKAVKIDRELWAKVYEFVEENKDKYPTMKFFTQKAILEKLEKEIS